MIPEPWIEQLGTITLVGIQREMSFANNSTVELWRDFRPRRVEINPLGQPLLYSLQDYGAGFDFQPHTPFVKWALTPVESVTNVPAGMEVYTLKGGLYAVFHYQGSAGDPAIFTQIFTRWLPDSGYDLDNRPHFERFGLDYDPKNPQAEEEIWIPIRSRTGSVKQNVLGRWAQREN